MSLLDQHRSRGAILAPDGIPLHFGDQKAEYRAALEHAVLMDRSHEGRIEARGRDRIDLIQRISTNDLLQMQQNEGRPTIFTNPNGRILDRIMVYNRGENALFMTEPGRNIPLLQYLQRQVFFNDDATFVDLTPVTRQFVLHGPEADAVIERFTDSDLSVEGYLGIDAIIEDVPVYMVRRKPITGAHWALIVPNEGAAQVWNAISQQGAGYGLLPAGSLVYNALRIRAGRPAGRELSTDYIPLEAGLWDEVSFSKGCYTGQEIIARMESRGRLAKTMVTLQLDKWVEAPADLYADGKLVGTLTSSVVTPDNEILGIGFVKVPNAIPDHRLAVGEGVGEAVITSLAGAQPPQRVND
jgi:folate-binding protein YgfZ